MSVVAEKTVPVVLRTQSILGHHSGTDLPQFVVVNVADDGVDVDHASCLFGRWHLQVAGPIHELQLLEHSVRTLRLITSQSAPVSVPISTSDLISQWWFALVQHRLPQHLR